MEPAPATLAKMPWLTISRSGGSPEAITAVIFCSFSRSGATAITVGSTRMLGRRSVSICSERWKGSTRVVSQMCHMVTVTGAADCPAGAGASCPQAARRATGALTPAAPAAPAASSERCGGRCGGRCGATDHAAVPSSVPNR